MFMYKSESEPRHKVKADKVLTAVSKTVRNWKGHVKSSLQ